MLSVTRMQGHSYPVVFDVEAPARWDRSQVVLRIAILLALGLLKTSLGWMFGALYLMLPIIAAVVISQRGGEGYLTGPGTRILSILRWWTAFIAYMSFLTDRFPTREEDLAPVRFDVAERGEPTVGRALLRLLTSLPEVVVLAVLSWVGGIVWLIAMIVVLVNERVPQFAWRYTRFVVRLHARLLVYHASLVDLYPPLGEPVEAEAKG